METHQKSIEPSVDVRIRHAEEATELYITAQPRTQADVRGQAASLMDSVAGILRRHDAAIMQERIFADSSTMDALSQTRAKSFAGRTDGVEPTWLTVPPNAQGPVCGMQVHAVAGCGRPKVLSVDGRPSGRLVRYGLNDYLTGCNLQADAPLSPDRQAQAMLAKAEALLNQAGGTLAHVARTWMWLGGILQWYGEFNRVRNDLFAARGLLSTDASGRLPASTGIGIGPWGGRICAMDFCAVLGGEQPQFLLAASKQGPASKYGSAFSRAAAARTPAGRTVYVSGTAAIDPVGQTTHIGDIRGQIEDTLTNVWAVLRDEGCRPEDIVQSIVYCKTPQVEQIFRAGWGDLSMPHLIVIADVCRDNLLFEVEAAAMPR